MLVSMLTLPLFVASSSVVVFPVSRKAAIYGGFVTMVTSTIAVGFLGWAYRKAHTPSVKSKFH